MPIGIPIVGMPLSHAKERSLRRFADIYSVGNRRRCTAGGRALRTVTERDVCVLRNVHDLRDERSRFNFLVERFALSSTSEVYHLPALIVHYQPQITYAEGGEGGGCLCTWENEHSFQNEGNGLSPGTHGKIC